MKIVEFAKNTITNLPETLKIFARRGTSYFARIFIILPGCNSDISDTKVFTLTTPYEGHTSCSSIHLTRSQSLEAMAKDVLYLSTFKIKLNLPGPPGTLLR